MHNLTPLSGFLGGALIGLAAALLMLLTGRIAGISGIFGGLLTPNTSDRGWRIAFIAGLIARATDSADAGVDQVLAVYTQIGWFAVAVGVGVMALAPFITRLMHLDLIGKEAEEQRNMRIEGEKA